MLPDLGGYENLLFIAGASAFIGGVITFWIRWEDRHKHPPAPPTPRR